MGRRYHFVTPALSPRVRTIVIDETGFSIAMTTFNGARFLDEQLHSMAEQTLLPVELQIGDDGSTDATEAIVRAFARTAPFPVVFHRNSTNLGYPDNFMRTAARCSAPWIAFADQDDVWLPHKLRTCAETIEKLAKFELLLIAHPVHVVDDRLKPLGYMMPEQPRFRCSGPLSRHLFWGHLGSAMVLRRELITGLDPTQRVPTLFRDVPKYPHDSWIATAANILGHVVETDAPLGLYRRHRSTVTTAGGAPEANNIAKAMNIGADHYAHVAEVSLEAATKLAGQAQVANDEAWSRRLVEGARKFEAYGDVLSARAKLYRSRRTFRRLRGFAWSALTGRYFVNGASALGWRSMAKDAFIAFTGEAGARTPAKRGATW